MPAAAATVEIVRGVEKAATLLDATRLEMLEHLGEPDSAAGLARRMKLPRQRVNYHLRELERHGLVELVEERRRGNCMERLVRATAKHYLISPDVLGKLGLGAESGAGADRFSSAYLITSAARAIRELALLRVRADKARQRLATLTMESSIRFRSAADRNAFAEELGAAVTTLAAKYHDETAEGGRTFRFLLAGWPAITSKGEDRGESARME